MTENEVIHQLAKSAKLEDEQAERVLSGMWEVIARELSLGEEVVLDELGSFLIVREPAREGVRASGDGSLEVEFEPARALVKVVENAMVEHPERFPDTGLPDMPDEEDVVVPAAGEEGVVAPVPPKDAPQAEERPLARVSHISFVDTGSLKPDKEILALLPEHIAKQYGAVPIELEEGVLTVAMVNPEDFDALQVIRKETGLAIKPALTTREGLSAVLDQYTGLQAEVEEAIENSDLGISKQDLAAAQAEEIDQTNDDAPTAHIVYSLLRRAVKERASDIHIEPYEKRVVVRFREDGVLMERVTLPKEIQSAITARLKILANLKIDEQRLPQDGRFSLTIDKRQVDFRFSTIPVVYGEKIVMRILDKSVGILALEDVGLIDYGFQILTKNLKRSHGMILVTGPTGSGKTTSLYAVLGKMMSPEVNILTLEDPVEYRVESINQSQVHTDIGYSFASGLRAVVRQDPDIVMLGEIRDQETAEMAVHAALTGHVVLSTLHTNDAAGSFPRLIDMGVEPFLITSSVHTVIGQRLARKICADCKEKVTLAAEEKAEIMEEVRRMPKEQQAALHEADLTFYRGKGCDVCGGKGYKGRVGIFEVLDVTEGIRDLVLKRSSGAVITEQAVAAGMVTMTQDGILKALKGMTTLEEVWRVTRE